MPVARRRRDGEPTVEQMQQQNGDDDGVTKLVFPPGDGGVSPPDVAGEVAERQAAATADSAPAIGSGPRLENGYTKADADATIAFILEQKQIIADASMKIASEMKSVVKRGGQPAGVQYAIRMLGMDRSKARRESAAIAQYNEWFVKPFIEKSEDEDAGEE